MVTSHSDLWSWTSSLVLSAGSPVICLLRTASSSWMASLVAYDDSDSEAETEPTGGVCAAGHTTGTGVAGAPGQAFAGEEALPTDPTSWGGSREQRLPLAQLGRGHRGSCPSQRLRWPRKEPEITLPASHLSRSSLWTSHVPASTVPLAAARLKPVQLCWDTPRSSFCAQSESEVTGKTASSSQRKRAEDSVVPYIPKRLRQLQAASAEAGKGKDVEPPRPPAGCAPAPCCVAPHVSEFIQPYLNSPYRETQVPSKVLFHLRGHRGPVNSIQWCPVLSKSHMLLSTSMDKTFKVVRGYKATVQQTLDILFLQEGSEFLSSTDASTRDSADRTIIAWDFGSSAKISNQIFHERYTCPSLALHPREPVFLAQTNGNYLALFSAVWPYRMSRRRRYEGHKVEGYAVGCECSPCGDLLVTGSADGRILMFSFRTASRACTLQGHTQACVGTTYHPVLPSVLGTCSWGGDIKIWH
ncbi:WD repeat-containing protein 25 isoform X3 [Lepus europaeus]|uniref:WD repeat-containing protein 25 isoform X3 n=1 Tax=Lepus europaeus TaxID=9983 RepID=UPI002B46FE26|nr:WD repeat-containing protein 25 isoform X3 [Lepus europaeus]